MRYARGGSQRRGYHDRWRRGWASGVGVVRPLSLIDESSAVRRVMVGSFQVGGQLEQRLRCVGEIALDPLSDLNGALVKERQRLPAP